MDLFTTPPAASALASGVSSGGESNNPPGKIRSACNRCHSQKLRCVIKIGQVSCERCLKLKTSCRFGPRAPRASLKPPEQATGCAQVDWHEPLSMSASITMPNVHSNAMIADVSDSDWLFSPSAKTGIAEGRATMHPDLCYLMQGDSANMQDMHWPGIFCESRNVNPLDHDGSADLDLTPINENIMSHASSLPSPGISDSYIRIEDYNTNDRLGTSPTSVVRKLASLNVALYECATKLPSMAEAGVSSAGIAGNGVHGSPKATLFAMDELFRLTTEFIDVMKCLSLVECETSATLFSMDPKQLGAQPAPSLVAYSQQLSHAGQPVTRTGMGPPSRSFSHVDEATMFMVVSCHCRLTGIYVSIFQMMQACIEYSLVPQMGKDWAIILPQLQVGSLASLPVHVDVNTPLSSATSSMYMLMITMLSSQLWEQLAGVMRAGVDVPTDSASASRCALADTMWDTVTDRTDSLSQTIDATKHLLQRYSVVAE